MPLVHITERVPVWKADEKAKVIVKGHDGFSSLNCIHINNDILIVVSLKERNRIRVGSGKRQCQSALL